MCDSSVLSGERVHSHNHSMSFEALSERIKPYQSPDESAKGEESQCDEKNFETFGDCSYQQGAACENNFAMRFGSPTGALSHSYVWLRCVNLYDSKSGTTPIATLVRTETPHVHYT